MFRALGSALRVTTRAVAAQVKPSECRISSIFGNSGFPIGNLQPQTRCLSFLGSKASSTGAISHVNSRALLSSPALPNLLRPELQLVQVPVRTLIKFSRHKAKRESVKTVLDRFYRLDWGIWIRTKAGRHKRLWRKRASRKVRSRRHVFTNSTQSWLLDTMVSKYWRRPKYFVDDPYNPYHKREEFFLTRKTPRPAV